MQINGDFIYNYAVEDFPDEYHMIIITMIILCKKSDNHFNSISKAWVFLVYYSHFTGLQREVQPDLSLIKLLQLVHINQIRLLGTHCRESYKTFTRNPTLISIILDR